MFFGFLRAERNRLIAASAAEDLRFEPMPFPTLNPLAWCPVAAGLWRQHELYDGTYDIGDLLDVLEFLEVKTENERRYRASLKPAEGVPSACNR
jgi:hypothetical protein